MIKSICILADDYPSEGRPVYVFVEQLVNSIVNHGVDVIVIAPQSLTHSFLRKEKLLPYHTVYYVNNKNSYNVYRPYFISFGNHFRRLSRFMFYIKRKIIEYVLKHLDNKPEILYGHFWHNANLMKDYAKKNSMPLFVACGEGDDALEKLIKELSHVEKETLVSSVTGVISVSSENKRKCIAYNLIKENDIIVLPNCVDVSIFHPFDSKSKRKELGLNDDDFVIIFVGAFIHRKGAYRLLEAVNMLNDSKVKIIYVGRYLSDSDKRLIGENISYIGKVEHDNLPYFLNCADVFVLPTLKEGCSNAIVEAIACGLPIISSNLPFNEDILDCSNSILVDPLNISELSNAIKKLKDNRVLRDKIATVNTTRGINYSINFRSRKILDFIETKINNK